MAVQLARLQKRLENEELRVLDLLERKIDDVAMNRFDGKVVRMFWEMPPFDVPLDEKRIVSLLEQRYLATGWTKLEIRSGDKIGERFLFLHP